MSIKAIIVDDERKARELLSSLIKKYCPVVEVVDLCASVEEARDKIAAHDPDIIFLDIQMPEETGFDLLDEEGISSREVIFTTAHSQYALDAFKANASGYLTKPVSPELLVKAVTKAFQIVEARKENQASKLLIEKATKGSERIGIPTLSGVNFITIKEIVRCQASSNYTEIFLRSGEKIVVSRTLKEFEEILKPQRFLRVHKSHIVNLECITSYHKSENATIKLLDGTQLPVGQTARPELEKSLTII
jgi:two-component system LytT family response regulator